MSILLDALKKSEQLRQLGKTPTIHSNVDEGDRRSFQFQRWIPIVMLLVAALVITWIGWNQYQPPFNVLDASGKPPDTTALRRAEQEEAAAEARAESLAAEPESVDSDGPQPEQSVIEPGLRTPGFQLPVQDFQAAAEGDPSEQTASDEQEQRERLSGSIARFEADDSPQPGEVAAGERLAASDTPYQEAEPEEVEPAEPQPLNYWELPQSLRDNLPDFNISVMVYAEQPEDRFLLMEGKRWVEKDSDGGLRLDEIRRDGAVFLYRNYRFLVKG